MLSKSVTFMRPPERGGNFHRSSVQVRFDVIGRERNVSFITVRGQGRRKTQKQ